MKGLFASLTNAGAATLAVSWAQEGPAGEAFVDYRVVVRNLGSDAVAVKLAATLPTGVSFLSTTVSQGSCGKPDVKRRLQCALGSVGTGFEHGALVTIRSAYDCAAL